MAIAIRRASLPARCTAAPPYGTTHQPNTNAGERLIDHIAQGLVSNLTLYTYVVPTTCCGQVSLDRLLYIATALTL